MQDNWQGKEIRKGAEICKEIGIATVCFSKEIGKESRKALGRE